MKDAPRLRVGVSNEWGTLKEVFVGNNLHDTFPRWSPDWGRYHGYQTLLAGREGQRLAEAFPERATAAQIQTDHLARLLEDHGVIVHRTQPLAEVDLSIQPVGAMAQFARDPILVVGRNLIETNLRMTFRTKEHLGYSQVFQAKRREDPDLRHVRMPAVSPYLPSGLAADFRDDPRPFIEGGDTFILGKDILVGFSSLASSPAGVEWLQHYLEPEGYQVHMVPLTPEWLHLDCAFTVLREGLCMCYTGAFLSGTLPEVIRDWEVIEATREEAGAMGTNTITLNPDTVIIGAEHKRLIAEIEKRGMNVLPTPFDQPSELGGAIRCSTHPLARDD